MPVTVVSVMNATRVPMLLTRCVDVGGRVDGGFHMSVAVNGKLAARSNYDTPTN